MSDDTKLVARIERLEAALGALTQILVDDATLQEGERKRILGMLRAPIPADVDGPPSLGAACARCGVRLDDDAPHLFVKDVGNVCTQCERARGPYR